MKWTLLLMLSATGVAGAQTPPPAAPDIELESAVFYVNDTADYARLASDPNQTSLGSAKTFSTFVGIGDIVAVNGKHVKGTWTCWHSVLRLAPNPPPGSTAADTQRFSYVHATWEILDENSRPIGSIMATGLSFGTQPPPGSLATTNSWNLAVAGGTGAFLGVRGQIAMASPRTTSPGRTNASVTEDPMNRRSFGGVNYRFLANLLPSERPEITGVYHGADFTPVTSARPARVGEILMLTASGLGPTVPGVDPGKPFPDAPLQEVNSNVDVTVNSKPAELINKIGFPRAVNLYRVDIRVPDGVQTGMVPVHISTGWIPGPETKIPVQ